ncbi:MAG: CotS family spore coat protein [Clostridia bacterium]|nr:CotS family spore coat protein [Clostridia bacterium]
MKGLTKMGEKLVESASNLIDLANQVLKDYDIVPQNVSVIQGGSIKTVWKIKTEDRIICLKRLKQTMDKALFSVNAQVYIRGKNGNVPGIYPDKRGNPIVTYNDQLFVLYEWIPGSDLNFGDKKDLSQALEGLAAFHVTSKGYKPPEEGRVSTKLGKWPDQYESMRNKFVEWKELSKTKSSTACYGAYLKYVDSMVDIANQSIQLIGKSQYKDLTAEGSESIVLCHQDYGKGNAILTDQGVFVLDLDGVTYDLPARDLRKIIGKRAENKGQWDLENIYEVVNWYMKVNPQSKEELNVLYIDLLYPHWFYGLVKNLFLNNKLLKSQEIEKIASLEQNKVSILLGLIGN